MKRVILIISTLSLLFSCGEPERIQLDPVNSQSLIQFDSSATNVVTNINGETTTLIPINVSAVSDKDRTIKVGVTNIENQSTSLLPQSRFSFEESITIPANQLRGELKLVIKDSGIPDNNDETLFLKIIGTQDFENFKITDKIHIVNVTQNCPIPDDFFIGTYKIFSPPTEIFCGGQLPSLLGDNLEVELSLGSQPNLRVFKARYAPNSCDEFSRFNDFILNFSCNKVQLSNAINTGVFLRGTEIIIENDHDNISEYSLKNNTSISFNVVNDVSGALNGTPITNQNIRLEKACEIPSDFFVGTYILNSPNANLKCDNSQVSIIGNDIEVEVTVGNKPNLRVFKARYAPGSCDRFSRLNDFILNLASCERLRLENQIFTGIGCGNEEFIIVDDANSISNYSINDDSQFSFKIIDNVGKSCNLNSFPNQTITLTKKK